MTDPSQEALDPRIRIMCAQDTARRQENMRETYMIRPSLDEKRAARNKLEAQFPGISTGITAKGVKVYLLDVFPDEIDGVPIEVEYIGKVVAQ